MAVTTPDNIVTPDDGDDYALVQDLGALADSVQEAITDWKNYGIGTNADRLALTGSSNPPLKDGLLWYATDTDIYWRYDGSAWDVVIQPWTTYTPTATNASGGTLNGRYMRIGKTVHVGIRHLSPTITGQPTYLLPLTAVDSATYWFAGSGVARDNSPVVEFQLVPRKISNTSVAPYLLATPATYTQFANVSATIPFTWTTNDFIDLRFTYEAA